MHLSLKQKKMNVKADKYTDSLGWSQDVGRGNKGCTGDGYSIFRTTNAGISWTEHVLPTSVTGTADTWNAEEAQVEVDSEGNVHAMWIGLDNMPYWSYSIDQGDTWSNATMIAPPINLS